MSALLSFALCINIVTVLATPTQAPTTKVPLLKQPLVSTNAKDFIQRQKSRIASFATVIKDSANGNASIPVVNQDNAYAAPTIINGQTFHLFIDTGSSNTWVSGGTPLNTTGATDQGDFSSINYGSGSFFGEEYITSVTLGDLTVANQWIGASGTVKGFVGYDGVLGLGPTDLTEGTVIGIGGTIPTVLDNLFTQGTIATEVLGVSFAPESGSEIDDPNGELTIGGIDNTKFSGSPVYLPLSTVWPYDIYWGLDTDNITYGSTLIQGAASCIVDTGTTLLAIPTPGYSAFLSATGGSTDSTGFSFFSTAPTEVFTIFIGGHPFPLTPAQYLVPEAQYANFGLADGSFYSWIGDGGESADSVVFFLGLKFLEHYYSVFDTTNSRIGFAPSLAG